MTPPTAPERCPTCDKPRAGDVEASHKEGCTCAACLAVCWRDWGVMCEEAPWRERALAAEARCEELIDVKNASLAVTYAAEEWHEGRISDADLRATVRLWCDEDGGAELAERIRSAQAAAARWAKVAPLIERLRAECGESPFRGRVPSLIECAAAILAATEATP